MKSNLMLLFCFLDVVPQNHSSKDTALRTSITLHNPSFSFLSLLLEFPKRNVNLTGSINSQSKCSQGENAAHSCLKCSLYPFLRG